MSPARTAARAPRRKRPRARAASEAVLVGVILAGLMLVIAADSIVGERDARLTLLRSPPPAGLDRPVREEVRRRFSSEPALRVRLGTFTEPLVLETFGVRAVALAEDFETWDSPTDTSPSNRDTGLEPEAGPESEAGPAATTPVSITTRSRVTVRLQGGALVIAPDEGEPVRFPAGAPVRMAPEGERIRLRVGERRIDGPVILRPRPNPVQQAGADDGAEDGADAAPPPPNPATRFDVIAELPMERYLPGVLAGELYAGWSFETYCAQAIAARSYAIHERARARLRGRAYDLEASTIDQAYVGEEAPERARDAVDATRGLILTTAEGRLLRAYYSSTCGGRAASAAAIWPATGTFLFNAAAPLQALPPGAGGWAEGDCGCQTAPLYRWEVRRSARDLSRRIRAWGQTALHPIRRLKTVTAIEVETTNPMGRPNRFTLTDSAGKTYSLTSDELRVASNTRVAKLSTPSLRQRVKSNDLAFEITGDRVDISGRGFGHGVGMCQFGAEGLSKRGWTWNQILERSYPGAQLERAYE